MFFPDVKFATDEKVTVTVNPGIKTDDGGTFKKLNFRFYTTPLTANLKINPLNYIADGVGFHKNYINKNKFGIEKINTVSADFPEVLVDTANNPGEGKYFLANFGIAGNDTLGNYLMILDSTGNAVKYKKLDQPSFDFKVQPNGELSYAQVISMTGGYGETRWIVTDSAFTPIDTFQCGNGYVADVHDFLLLPNGHALLMAYDPEPLDMSKVVDGENPNATVVGGIIQELDNSKNVIFQWRSWDYLPITDSYEPLTTKTLDYLHINAIELDNDGNILFSSRHFSSIVKIDRQTGEIMWVMGVKKISLSSSTRMNQTVRIIFLINMTYGCPLTATLPCSITVINIIPNIPGPWNIL